MQVNRPARPHETSEWALTVVGGPSAGTRLAWDQAEMVLGREAVGAALFRGDRAVSRRHAVLRLIDGTCVVEDHNSTNGTFVNDVPIERPTVLRPEDELLIGSTRLRLAPALADTALLAAVPAPEPEAASWDGTPDGGPTAPQPAGVTGTPAADTPRVPKAGRLALSILAAIAGTVLASALNGSPQLRLAAAVLGSAVPAFMTEPGRHQRAGHGGRGAHGGRALRDLRRRHAVQLCDGSRGDLPGAPGRAAADTRGNTDANANPNADRNGYLAGFANLSRVGITAPHRADITAPHPTGITVPHRAGITVPHRAGFSDLQRAGVAASLVRGHVGHAAPLDAVGYSGRTVTTRLTAVP
jgi:hypothetical protein